jgi:hypothetical protein
MGKVILEFDSVEEQDDIKSALNGYKWKMAVWDIDQLLRTTTKYGSFKNRPSTNEEAEMADILRDEIREILSSYDLNMD